MTKFSFSRLIILLFLASGNLNAQTAYTGMRGLTPQEMVNDMGSVINLGNTIETAWLDRVEEVANGRAVIIGEWASGGDAEIASRLKHVRYFTQYAAERGICLIWWDVGLGFWDRRTTGGPEGILQKLMFSAKKCPSNVWRVGYEPSSDVHRDAPLIMSSN